MTTDLTVAVKTLLILGILLLIARVLGRRTLSELTFYDFVIGLVIGEIGGAVITQTHVSIRDGLVALFVATVWSLFINRLTLKSIVARKIVEAEPLMVILKGKILEDNLKKRFYNINDLLEMLRKQGIFDPGQLEAALIESDGQLSILKKAEDQTPTCKDMNLQNQAQLTASALIGSEIIINGKIIDSGLAKSGLTPEQLKTQLNSIGITNLTDVSLAMLTPEGKLYVDKCGDT